MTSLVPLNIPSPEVNSISIAGINIHFYALFILSGIIIAWIWASNRFVARGGDKDDFFDIAFVAVIVGIIGARIYHVGVNWQHYFAPGIDPLSAFRIWEGGIGIWGAIAAGGLGAFLMTKYKQKKQRPVSFRILADSIAPTLLVAQAIGRLGNWVNQELYGEATDVPWALEITCVQNSQFITGCIPGTYHPTFLYEALWNLLACLIIVYLSKQLNINGGRVFMMYLIAYPTGRLIMETLRVEPSNMLLGIRIHVFFYLATLIVAIFVFIIMSIRARKYGEKARVDSVE